MLLTALLSFVVLLALPTASLAQSALTDDAHVSLSQGSANHGTNPNLNVSSVENIYLKFKLSPTLPAATPGSKVERATLKLYVGVIHTAGKLDVYAVLGQWDESAITGSTAPPIGDLVATSAQVSTDQKGKFIVIDITPLVRQWLGSDGQGANGIPNHGLALLAHPTDQTTPELANIIFDSKENSQTSHEPQLNIYLQGTAGGLQKVEHDATLTGEGTTALPLGVASGGITTVHLANDAVTGEKIANNAVASSQLADGAVTSPKITVPLSLVSADANFTLSVGNTGAGAAITANGAINTSKQYNIGGNRVLSVSGTQSFPNSNIFVGVGAGSANTTGFQNAFFGYHAGLSNTTGGGNSFFGNEAGRKTTTGRGNSFFGLLAGADNTTGSANSFFGGLVGFRNTTGDDNSFFGVETGTFNTTGSANSFFGVNAGAVNTTGSHNTFFGRSAGFHTTASQNSFFGSGAGANNTTGENNIFSGYFTGLNNKTGSHNTLIGANADVGADNLSHATAIGANAIVSTSNTVVLGRSADTVQVPGNLNIAGSFGANILDAATQFNLGGNRILSNPGSSNLYAGRGAGQAHVSGTGNSFFGDSAGLNSNSNDNSFFGALAGLSNTFGSSNVFFGASAGFINDGGHFNVFVGDSAGVNNTRGGFNTFIGSGTGFSTFDPPGHNNTLIGSSSFAIGGLSNATAIGSKALVTQSNSLVLGGISGVNSGTDTNVGIGTTAPKTKLHLKGGKVYVESNGQGVILKATGGACFELTVTDAGELAVTAVACP